VEVVVVSATVARAFLEKATLVGHQARLLTVAVVVARTLLAVTAAERLAVMVAQVRATRTTAPTRHTRAVAVVQVP
jgi:hypothetical protein